jgi:hypothetical protein
MSSIDEFSARGDVDAEFLGGTEDLVVRVAQELTAVPSAERTSTLSTRLHLP